MLESERLDSDWLPREHRALDTLIDVGLDQIELMLDPLLDTQRFAVREVERKLWNSLGEVAVDLLQPALDQISGTSNLVDRI